MTTDHCQIKAANMVNATCTNSFSSPKWFTYLCLFSRTTMKLFFVFCPQFMVVIYRMVGLWGTLQKESLFILCLSFILGTLGSFFFQILQIIPFYFALFSLGLHYVLTVILSLIILFYSLTVFNTFWYVLLRSPLQLAASVVDWAWTTFFSVSITQLCH